MKSISWSSTILLVLVLCQLTFAAPSVRVKREDEDNINAELNPITSEDAQNEDGLDREKRKLPEATFAGKNAILGFVFGKINSLIDAKTRLIDQLDKTNIQKNKQHHIETPKPIKSLNELVQAVITPKITAITGKIGGLSGSFLGGGSAGGSGGSSGHGNAAAGGLGNVVSSIFRLSGPILQGSSGGGSSSHSGSNSVTLDDSKEDDDDDDSK